MPDQLRGERRIAVSLHLEYRDLEDDDPNFLCVKESPEESCYRILIDRSQDEIVAKLEELKESIGKGELKPWEFRGMKALWFDKHLYQPLLYLARSMVSSASCLAHGPVRGCGSCVSRASLSS